MTTDWQDHRVAEWRHEGGWLVPYDAAGRYVPILSLSPGFVVGALRDHAQ